jgi:hypothetical protein
MIRKLKGQPPSRARYAAAHPTIGVHVDRDTYQRMVELRQQSGFSLGQLVRQALGVVEMDITTVMTRARDEGVAEGRKVGYAEARARYRLTVDCSFCRKAVELAPGSPPAPSVAEALAVAGWGHKQCHERRQRGNE